MEVERTRSITQAAQNLFMAQPNLSKAIRELEESLGITIFKRTPGGTIPTAQGAEFLQYAKNILAQLERMQRISSQHDAPRQTLSVCAPRGSYIGSAFTRFVSRLDMDGSIAVSIKETNSVQTIANVSQGRFNIGIIRYAPEYESYFLDYLAEKKLTHELLWEFDYRIVFSRRHPLASAAQIHMDDLRGYVEILHGDNSIPYLRADSQSAEEAESSGKRIFVFERCNQFDILGSIDQTYMWVSPIPGEWLERYELTQRRCAPPVPTYKDVIILRSDYIPTALDEHFISLLHKSRDEVSAQEE